MKTFLVSIFIITAFFSSAQFLFANSFNDGLKQTAQSSGYTSNITNTNHTSESLSSKVGTILEIIISLVGIFFFVLMMYGGYRWMMAQENASETDKAKTLITNAVFGLLVVLSAYAITLFVSSVL